MLVHFRRYFVRGLAVLLPTILTIGILVWGYNFIQGKVSAPINKGLVRVIITISKADAQTESELVKFWVEGPGSIAGFIIAVIGVFIVGVTLASVVGRSIWHMFERSIMRIPILNRVYPYLKQVTDFFFQQAKKDQQAFTRVVAVEYPRKGIWSIGMVTGSGLKQLAEKTNTEMLTVFIPTSPSPVTGFIIMVAKEDTIALDITVEESFRYTISGGVISPDNIEAKSSDSI